MTRDDFWEFIDAVRSVAMFDRRRLPGALHDELAELDEDELREFIRHFDDVRTEANRRELWAAAWVAGGGADEQDFSHFRDWLITLGREAFEDALHHPECILNHADASELRDPFDPHIEETIREVYEQATGETELSSDRSPPREPTGREWQPADLPRRFPKLWQFYNSDE
jgi:hypothetical protein